MKKGLLLVGTLLFSSAVFGQSAYDALSYCNTNPVLGTARYSAMAGAFGAFGGNVSTTKDNPAGVGIYKRFDLTFTPELYIDNDRNVGVTLANFGLVINFRNHRNREKGYITSSLGISYNRLRNFSRYTAVSDLNNSGLSLSDRMVDNAAPDVIFDNAKDLGLVGLSDVQNEDGNYNYESKFSQNSNIDKVTRFTESGHVGQWDFTYGVNISNRVYVGGGMGVASIQYSVKDKYDETSYNDDNDQFYLDNYFKADGVGVNFKLGVMAKMTDFFRLGFAIHTPTFYNIDESYSIEMDYNNQYPNEPQIDYADYNYDLRSPFKMQVSAGFIIAKRALIGIQYDMENYKSMRMSKDNEKYEAEESVIREDFRNTHMLRLGAEVKVIPEFALRLGYAYQSDLTNDISDYAQNMYIFRSMSLPKSSHYITAGLGYEGDHFYCDLAYVFRNQKTVFYSMLPQIDSEWNLNLKNHDVLLSLGWRF